MLTKKQRKYVQERRSGCNMRQSAIRAGYAEKHAHVQGYRLENMPKIQAAINRADGGFCEEAERATQKIEKMNINAPVHNSTDDPLVFFRDMMNDVTQDPDLRLRAAQQLASFTISKPSAKKPTKAEERKKNAENSFFATALKAVK